ncbi:MAG: phage tail spike protein [Peptostreptococcaceae bacterium]
MIHLKDKNKNKIAGLIDYTNLYIEKTLESGDKLLSFFYPKTSKFYFDIEEECYIETKEDEFIIKEKNVQNDYTEFKCILNLEDLEGKPWERFDSTEQPIDKALALALAGTGWIVGNCSLKKKRTVRKSNCSSLDVIRDIKKAYRCNLVFNTLTRTIDVYEHLGEDKGTYFIDSLNLTSLGIQSNSYDYYTRIIPIGKDNLRITSINDGKDYVENYQYSKKVKTIYWIDDRYTIVENLKEDAEAKLNEISKPYRSYAANIVNLAKLNDKYKNILDYKLGDTIYLISKDNRFRDKQRIVKVIEHPDEPELDSAELANTILSFEDIQTQFQEATDTIDNITTDNGTVDGTTVDAIETKQIKDFDSEVIKASNIEAINIKVKNLEANNVTISGQLTAIQATIGTLTANVATIDKLTVTHSAYISDLQASKASITQLEAVNATIHVLESNVGKIETLVNGNLSSENIQAGGITSDRLTIANGFITNAMIMDLDVSKVNAGDISTNKFRIKSDDGGIEIVGATQQFKDKNNRVRIQMGQDAKGNFNFIIRGEDGTSTLIDHTGVKEKAIADDLIKSNMISSDAVGEKQIDYSSFSEGFNKETNTHTLKATKIKLDNQNQTLDLAFNSLTTEVQGIQIGGRNLIKNSKELYVNGSDYRGNVDISTNGKIVVKEHTQKANAWVFIDDELSEDICKDNEYCFSIDVKTHGLDGAMNGCIEFNLWGNVKYDYWVKLENTYGEWKRYVIKVPKVAEIIPKALLCFTFYANSRISYIEYRLPQLEKGNKATDWTSAPEDVEGKIKGVKEITTSQSTTIGIMQGEISTAINNSQIIKDGQTILLKDDYNRTVQTVNSMSNTIGQHTTDINQHTGEITGVTARVNVVERDLNGINARVSSTEADLYTTKNKVATIEIDLSKVTTRVSSTEVKTDSLLQAMSEGRILFDDPTFLNGNNAVNVYNNTGNGNVTVTRIAKVEGCPTNSTHCLEIKTIGQASPGWGGFYFGNPTRANAKFMIKIIAKIPVGRRIGFASNSYGTGGSSTWITSSEGTGKWETYICYLQCGDSGSFSSTSFLYLDSGDTPTTSNPLVWHVGYATVIDITDSNNLESRMKYAETKITKDAIISTVSSQFYKKCETDSKYASHTQIEQLAGQINSKVDVNGVKSLIQQNPNDVMIGFNGINNRININPRSMDFTSTNGNRDMSLYGGQLCAFNSGSNQFLATAGSIIADNYNINGAGFLLSKHCNHFLIGRDNTWDDIFTNRQPKPTHYLDIDFNAYQIKLGLPLLTGDINLRGNSLYDANVGYIKDWFGFGWRLHADGHQLMYAEGHRVKFNVPVSFDGNELMNPKLYTNAFYYTNGHLAFCQAGNGANIMMNGLHWDWNGFNIVNAKLIGSQMSYSLMATSPGGSVGADTASVETMLLQEDFSKYDEVNNAVLVDMNEGFKSVYANNKKLENENEQLKQENKNLNKELETTKNALDVILMNAV